MAATIFGWIPDLTLTSPPSLSLDLEFRPTSWMRLQHRWILRLGRLLPIPREQEILQLATTALGPVSPSFGRRLFLNALSEACWIWQGGWKYLALPAPEDLDPTWTRRGSPTLFLSMHHGNWEWLAGLLYHFRSDSIGVARSAHHPLGQKLLRWARAFHRTPVYYDRDAVLRASHQLHKGGLVAFLADQRPPTGGLPGQWLSHQTLVTPLPSLWIKTQVTQLWTGQLIPTSPSSYHLDLCLIPDPTLQPWDQSLDAVFLPWIQQNPTLHFGFFHRRLVSRGTFPSVDRHPQA